MIFVNRFLYHEYLNLTMIILFSQFVQCTVHQDCVCHWVRLHPVEEVKVFISRVWISQ